MPSSSRVASARRRARSRRLLHHVAELAGEHEPAGFAGPSRVASTNSTSPPAPVTARPVATPAPPCARRLRKNRGRPSASRTSSRRRRPGRSAARRDAIRRHLAQHLAELALELAHAGLARVVGDDRAQRVVGDVDLVLAQAVALELRGQQVVAGDGDLLVLGVAVERMTSMRSSSGPGIVSRARWRSR
jgi:hypothetical protein